MPKTIGCTLAYKVMGGVDTVSLKGPKSVIGGVSTPGLLEDGVISSSRTGVPQFGQTAWPGESVEPHEVHDMILYPLMKNIAVIQC